MTDADLCLGYLDDGYFLGGEMRLDRAAAEGAIRAQLAEPLGVTLERAAWGVHEVVNDNMARAMRVHCLEQGRDPREYTLVAFGGAGPVHAFGVAQTVGIKQCVFPAGAGVMSAFGFLVARPSIELVRAYVTPLEQADAAVVGRLYRDMEREGRELLRTAGVRSADVSLEREVAVRFVGQSYELIVPVPAGKLTAAVFAQVHERFLKLYVARYHRTTPAVPVEAVTWRVLASGPRPALRAARPNGAAPKSARKGVRRAYFASAGGFIDVPVYDRYLLRSGQRLRGPAIVEERESTAVIGPGGRIEVDAYGNLEVAVPSRGA